MITVLGPKIGLSELAAVPLLRPKLAGSRWSGIQHHELARNLLQGLHERGISVPKSVWTLGRNGQALYGGLSLKFPANLGVPELSGLEYALGVRHANDCTRSLQFFAGVTVLICSNGVATGSFILCRKHTSGLDLGGEIRRGIDRLLVEARQAGSVVNRMQNRALSDYEVDHVLCEAGRRRLLAWGRLGLVEQSYSKPGHEEFSSRTAWSLYNAFNEIVKRVHPAQQLTSLDRFRELVLN